MLVRCRGGQVFCNNVNERKIGCVLRNSPLADADTHQADAAGVELQPATAACRCASNLASSMSADSGAWMFTNTRQAFLTFPDDVARLAMFRRLQLLPPSGPLRQLHAAAGGPRRLHPCGRLRASLRKPNSGRSRREGRVQRRVQAGARGHAHARAEYPLLAQRGVRRVRT